MACCGGGVHSTRSCGVVRGGGGEVFDEGFNLRIVQRTAERLGKPRHHRIDFSGSNPRSPMVWTRGMVEILQVRNCRGAMFGIMANRATLLVQPRAEQTFGRFRMAFCAITLEHRL